MKNLIILGSIGVGKGSIAQLLIRDYKYKSIIIGDLLRREMELQTELGKNIENIMNSGNLVSDEISGSLFKKYIEKENILVDGFPGTLKQLDCVLETNLDYTFILITANKEKVISRILNRRICFDCKQVYSNEYEKCPNCNGKLIKRKDDKIKIIKERYAWSEKKPKLYS